MAKVTWTFQALEDQLANFPYSGRVVTETYLPVMRELIVYDHRIIYSVISSEEVSILSVRSSKRPLSEFPSSRE